MVSKNDDRYIIWPVYFDRSTPRKHGRRICHKYAVEKPDLETIFKAAKSLGLNPTIENNAAYPSKPWKKTGRVLVDKKEKKSKILLRIAKNLTGGT